MFSYIPLLIFTVLFPSIRALPITPSLNPSQLSRRTPSDPVFTVSSYLQHTSPNSSSLSFQFRDDRPAYQLSIACEIPASPVSIYLDTFTTCGKNKTDERVSFQVSEGEVVLRRAWVFDDYYFVGYAPQATYWSTAVNASRSFDAGVTYTRPEEWKFPVTSMTAAGKKQ